MTTKTGLELAKAGAQRAAAHADHVHGGGFTSAALAAFRAYAWTHAKFTTEDVRNAFADQVPPAPDNRAWGNVARIAVREGVCKRVGVTRAKSPACHAGWIAEYASLILFA